MPAFVGCDLGTTGSKAAVVDLDGTVLGTALVEVPLRHPRPGWAEQDLAEIEASGYEAVGRALADAGSPTVAGVAFSSQMSGIGAITADFSPAIRYDSWLDGRCAPYVRLMAEHAERVVALSGCPPTSSHGPKMLWWQHEEPDAFAAIHRFVVPSAYVAGRLVGLHADEAYLDRTFLHFSNVSDTAGGVWSAELLDTFGLDKRVLPRIVDPLDVVGEVTRDGERASGLPAGTPVAAGLGDTIAAALGAGVVEPGQAFDSAGTASVLAVCTERFTPAASLLCAHAVVPGRFYAMNFINGGGLALPWFTATVAGGSDYADLEAAAAGVEPGSGGLVWLPHFQGRVLPPEPDARAGWVGVTGGISQGHLYRALLEGIAYEYAAWAEDTGGRVQEARVIGGGAASHLWNQIKADVLGVPWVPSERQEAGVLGCALVAAAATGAVNDLPKTAQAWQRTGTPVRPDPERHARYRRLRAAARDLARAVDPAYAALAEAAR